jgi:hypothetical protein
MTDDKSPKSASDDSWRDTFMMTNDKETNFMYYLDKIPPKERAVLLKKLATAMGNEDTSAVKSRLATTFASAASEKTKDGDETEEQDDAKPPAMVSSSGLAPVTKIPARQLRTGLLISLVPRNDDDLSSLDVVLCKSDRGADAIARKKTRDKIVKALDPKLSANNISRIITATDASSFDIAADALAWQSHLQNIRKFCVQYDMVSLLQIPTGVDFTKPERVASATRFKDAINNWSSLEDETYFKWQEFIRRFGSPVEIESDSWLHDTLLLSMDETLHAKVESDISNISSSKLGAITTLRYIIKRMVIKNQESLDALENYIKTFDITKFLGENVPIACLCLKAVAKALGTNDLPKNVICKVLEGFSKSSTKSFNEFCASQIALRRGSLAQDIVRNTSLYSQLVSVLTDLENSYLELIGGNLWAGVGHPGLDQHGSSFVVTKENKAKALRDGMPWEEWVQKYAKCNHCSKIGHICPDCPLYLKAIASGAIKKPEYKPKGGDRRTPKKGSPQKGSPNTPRRNFLKDPKARAFLSAFQSFMCESDDSDDGDVNNEDNAVEDDDENVQEEDAEDLHGFLSMIGSLKD